MIATPAVVGATVGLDGALAAELALFLVADFEISGVWFGHLCDTDAINVDLRAEKVLADQVGFGEANVVEVFPIRRLVVVVCHVVVGLRVVKVERPELLLSFTISIGFSVEVSRGVCTFVEGVNGV